MKKTTKINQNHTFKSTKTSKTAKKKGEDLNPMTLPQSKLGILSLLEGSKIVLLRNINSKKLIYKKETNKFYTKSLR